jgi:hypothetical protein
VAELATDDLPCSDGKEDEACGLDDDDELFGGGYLKSASTALVLRLFSSNVTVLHADRPR